MKIQIVGNVRRDGKVKVQFSFAGSPNMFGGNYPTKFVTVLKTVAEARKLLAEQENQTKED
tara:strand:- start:2666 stop:2848 length:183 start_codon:yes stop_codon:yes gene_type:complete